MAKWTRRKLKGAKHTAEEFGEAGLFFRHPSGRCVIHGPVGFRGNGIRIFVLPRV